MSYSKRSDRQKQLISYDPGVLKVARQVYRLYQDSYPHLPTPKGIAVNNKDMTGKLIYTTPVLLPDETFVPLDITVIEPNDYYVS